MLTFQQTDLSFGFPPDICVFITQQKSENSFIIFATYSDTFLCLSQTV